MFKGIWASLICVALAACGTTALEPQNQTLKSENARIYVMWPKYLYGTGRQNVLIDDASAGIVGEGSYLSADRPAGRHKISIKAPIGFLHTEHEFNAAAGRNYYFVLNVRAAQSRMYVSGVFLDYRVPGTVVGKPIDEEKSNTGLFLSLLDDNAGKTLLSKLTAP